MPDNDISQGGNEHDAKAQVPIETGGTFTPGADDDSGLKPGIVSQEGEPGIVSQEGEPGIVSQEGEPGLPGEG